MPDVEEYTAEDINLAHEVGRLRGDVNGLIESRKEFEKRIEESINILRDQFGKDTRQMRDSMEEQFRDMRQDMSSSLRLLDKKFDKVIESNNKAQKAKERQVPIWTRWTLGIVITALIAMGGWVTDLAIHGHL